MSNYWAIAIGINQYQNFQPLLYAQWDAQALWNYWIKEGGVPQAQCVLLTDSTSLGPRSSDTPSSALPTKATIQQQLIQLGHHQVGTEDTLWCFFSGYGFNHQGKDYLMPMDGDPRNIDRTGISAEAFFSALSAFPTDRIVVLLDLKRLAEGYAVQSPETLGAATPSSDRPLSGRRLGDNIAQQASQAGIATILASQPDQLSHETLTLRQGLFTATLLEGLRTKGCFQLGQLTQYLENRLPELSEYHWRPRQSPMVIMTASQSQQVLLEPSVRQPVGVRSGKSSGVVKSPPKRPTSIDAAPGVSPLPQDAALAFDPSTLDGSSDSSGLAFTPLAPSDASATTTTTPTPSTPGSTSGSTIELPVLGKELSYTPQPRTASVNTILPPDLRPDPDAAKPTPPETVPEDIPIADDPAPSTRFWGQWLQYCLPLLALMMLFVLKLNWPALTRQTPFNQPTADTATVDPDSGVAVGTNGGTGDAIAPPEASSPVADGGGTTPDSGANAEPSVDGTDGTDATANGDDLDPSAPDAENESSNRPGFLPGLFGNNSTEGSEEGALARAKAAMNDGNYEDAAIWLQQVPVEAQTEEYEQVRAEVEAARSESGQANQEILDRAIATLNEARDETRVNQASDFGRAIAIANTIQQGQPLYDEAQAYIMRWGEVILDLAQARAKSGEYEKAIATVNLIEDDLPLLYPKAQRLLADWQGAMGVDTASRSIIDAAKADIVKFPDQAFPYNRGIGKLREIEPDDPLYGEAQTLINDWSEEILAIARGRAQQGDTQAAINTAQYVPQDTAAYEESLAAIEQWSQ